MALEGIHYLQTYDWFMLMSVITLGYIGWMVHLLLHVLESYTSLPEIILRKEQQVQNRNNNKKIYLYGSLLMGIIFVVLYLEHSPPLYHAYTAIAVFLWTRIFGEYQTLKALWRTLCGRNIGFLIRIIATCAVSIFVLELLVHSFTERKLYTWCFLVSGVVAFIHLHLSIPWKSGIPTFLLIACWFLSVFTLMPAEIPDNTSLVVASGALIIMVGVASRWLDLHAEGIRYWQCITNHSKKQRFPMLFLFQILLIGLSSVMVWLTTSQRTQKQELLVLHQFTNWSIAGVSMIVPLFSATSLLSRLTSIFLGFAPPFLLLSIGYEALFYSAISLVLMAWVFYENALFSLDNVGTASDSIKSVPNNAFVEDNYRSLQLSDVRIPLVFMVLFNVAFFGTGNFASIASFEISSVYRFITVFSPFLMAALLIFKLFIPFMLVICAFSAITKLIRVPRLGCYFFVILFSDVMTIHFFFLVKNKGSWMEIGNSISHFGIVSAQVVFVLLLFALTNIYTKDIQIISSRSSSRKEL